MLLLRLSVGVILLCGVPLTNAAPNSWPPKMKNFDIWGDIDAAASSAAAAAGSEPGASAYDDGGADGNLQNADAAEESMSTAEIVQTSSSSYGNSSSVWQRDSRGK